MLVSISFYLFQMVFGVKCQNELCRVQIGAPLVRQFPGVDLEFYRAAFPSGNTSDHPGGFERLVLLQEIEILR